MGSIAWFSTEVRKTARSARVSVLCNKRITTRDNGNVQSHDQEESKLNSTISENSGAHTLTHDKIIKSPFNKNNVATIKTNEIPAKILLLGPAE